MPASVSVLGAGVVGLAVGIRLLEEVQDVRVTIHADLTGDDTTSRGSVVALQPRYAHALLLYLHKVY